MAQEFDFVVVGGGSAGAVIAARLSEDPTCTVALVEAGSAPPPAELMPAACATLQNNPETDWMYTADAGGAGRGLAGGRMMVPRGKMLGGSSAINYMAYVRGHPGDFDAWAADGATGWSYDETLAYFKKSEGLAPSGDIVVDTEAHNTEGPLGVSVRAPVLRGAQEFVQAAVAAGIPVGDYNGRDRGGPDGVVSLLQTTTRDGKRSSTYHAFLEGDAEQRPNLDGDQRRASDARDARRWSRSTDRTRRRVPHRRRRDRRRRRQEGDRAQRGRGRFAADPSALRHRTEARARSRRRCVPTRRARRRQAPEGPSAGRSRLPRARGGRLDDRGRHLARARRPPRAPAGPLPADPADDAGLPPELQALKQEAERRLTEWQTTGHGLVSSSLYDACAWFSTGLGDEHTHDAQIGFFGCGYNADLWRGCFRVDPDEYFDDPAVRLGPDAESMIVLANPVQAHSEGEIVLASADPIDHPDIRMNYYADPYDMEVMIAVIRRVLDVVAHWPSHREIGPLMVPPFLAAKHGHVEGDTPSDALLEDLARHYSFTVYHLTSTCRMGDVVDPRLRVNGVANLRVADASVMPNVVSGNTNAASIMIGEKAAEMIAADNGVKLTEFVGSER